MSSTLAGAFGVAALFVAVLALVFAIQAMRAQSGRPATVDPPAPDPEPQDSKQGKPGPSQAEPKQGTVKAELRRLSKDLEAARAELRESLQHLAVVRYDAFGDTGGRLSWSMALLDEQGDGVVLTSINSRNAARSYAKEVKNFESDAKLSPEEEEAIETLRKDAAPTVDPDQV